MAASDRSMASMAGPMDLEDLRLAVYDRFARTGLAATVPDLAADLGADADEVEGGLRALHDARHIVLDGDGRIVMAHPFASIPFGFSVMGERTIWWGGCAWDSFAIPNLVPDEPECSSRPSALGATGRTPGWSVATVRRRARRWPTS